MMLELLLTRADRKGRQVLANARGLDWLVLDELHTYRGRQGADVAMLVRRLRDRLSPDHLRCIGTSATMASSDAVAEDPATVVANTATMIFGDRIEPEAVIGETLDRATEGHVDRAVLKKSIRTPLANLPDVRRFVRRALDRVGITFDGKSVPVDALPDMVREALSSRGIQGRTRVSFDPVAQPGVEVLHRTHPIVATLSDALSEGALEDAPDAVSRSGAWISRAATMMRTLALLRVRHRIRRASAASDDFLLAEEIVPVLWEGTATGDAAIGLDALKVLDEEVGATLPEPVRRTQVLRARARIEDSDALTAIAQSRAETLTADHDRLRVASSTRGRTIVEPVLPPDLIALHVILPEAD